MSLPRGVRGVIDLLGPAPAHKFESYLGAEKPAFQNSLVAIGGSNERVSSAAYRPYVFLLSFGFYPDRLHALAGF